MKTSSLLWVLISGMLFGAGLAMATMVRPEVVLSFLRYQDFGLLFVLGGAAGVALLAYQLAPRVMKKPLFAPAFGTHPSALDGRTLWGSAIFGAGWGLCGVCPGPAIAGLGAGNWPVALALVGMLLGALVQGLVAGTPSSPAPAPAKR